MTFARTHIKSWWMAVLTGLLFVGLLGIRMDLFRVEPVYEPPDGTRLAGSETWMNILQNGNKIGYSHRRLVPREQGYEIDDTTYMRINTMGMVQDLHLKTAAGLNADLTLARFDFSLRSNLFDFRAKGEVAGDVLSVTIDDQTTRIPLERGIYLTGGVMDAAFRSDLAPGEERTFTVFDPATLGRRPVRVKAEGDEVLEIMGRREKTRKLTLDFMGATQTAWIDGEGSVVQETGLMGITLRRATQQEAFEGLTLSPSQDLTRIVSLAANVELPEPEKLSRLTLGITGIKDFLFLDGDRQTLNRSMLVIQKESVPDPDAAAPEGFGEYLAPTPFIESGHPEIIRQVASIVAPEDTPLQKVQKLTAWVFENIEKRPVLSVPSALQTLRKKMGDCNEHAVLLAAMARAAGIPAQIEAGLVYLKGRFYYHAWNALYLDRWVTVDALMNQIPADVTHIRFVRGEPRQQIDLMGVIGAVRLKILEKS